MELRAIFERMIGEGGVSVVLIAGRDGMLLEGLSQGDDADMESMAALAARMLQESDRIGRVVEGGAPAQIRVRYDQYLLLVEPLSETDVLVAGVAGSSGERLFDAVARYRLSLQETLGSF